MSERIRKINELIREESSRAIAEAFAGELFLTVTVVETTPDLKRATIWISVMGDEAVAMEKLEEKKSQIQHEITSKMATKYTPKIDFKVDHSQAYVQRIEELLDDDSKS